MTDQSSIVSQMIQALAVVEPDLDTSVGTTVRNILEASAAQTAQAYFNTNIAQYQYAIDTLSGSALDAFCSNFGFIRFAAKRATGSVTFTQLGTSYSLNLPIITIPAGTLVATSDNSIVFQTTATYSLIPLPTSATVTVPIQAVVGGSNGNVAAGAITNFNTPLNGISSLSNVTATTGGTDAESDAAFRARFKATIFRSFTGTAQSFLGAALENPNVVNANVIGSVSTHTEQVTLTGTTPTGTCLLSDVQYVYPYNVFLTAGDLTVGPFLNYGTDYTVTTVPLLIDPTSANLAAKGTSFSVAAANNSNPTTSNPGFPANGATYYYKIAYINYFGSTMASVEESVTVSSSAIQNIILTFPGFTTLYPNVNSSTVDILIYRGTSAGNESLVAIVPASESSWTDTNAQNSYSLPVDFYGPPATTNTTGKAVEITSLSTTTCPAGTYQIQFDYIPASSRNQYPNILNCIDIYVNGSDVQQASQSINFAATALNSGTGPVAFTNGSFNLNVTLAANTPITQIVAPVPLTLPLGTQLIVGDTLLYLTQAVNNTVANTSTTLNIQSWTPTAAVNSGSPVYYNTLAFSPVPGSPMYFANFQRANGTYPTIGNTLIPLSFTPVTLLPSQITSGGNTYYYNNNGTQNYWIVNAVGTQGMSNASLGGIEWPLGQSYTNATLAVDYSFNAVPQEVDQSIQLWRLLCQDVMVHEAYPLYLDFYLVVVLSPGASVPAAQPLINAAISNVVSQVSFNQILEVSTILAAVLGVQGVANVRFATPYDNMTAPGSNTPGSGYAIQSVTSTTPSVAITTFVDQNNNASDIVFTATTYPVFNQTFISTVAQNAFVPQYISTPPL